ncbi:MAG: hypothetical protein ACYDG6_14775 [Thermincolia bacterium]
MTENYRPQIQTKVLINLPVDNEPLVLGQFAELADAFNGAMTEWDLRAEIVHLKQGVFFLITEFKDCT